MNRQSIRSPVRILGIDPGLRRTGWGVIEVDGNRLAYVGCGSVEPAEGLPLASRLLAIHEGLAAVLSGLRPSEAQYTSFPEFCADAAIEMPMAPGCRKPIR